MLPTRSDSCIFVCFCLPAVLVSTVGLCVVIACPVSAPGIGPVSINITHRTLPFYCLFAFLHLPLLGFASLLLGQWIPWSKIVQSSSLLWSPSFGLWNQWSGLPCWSGCTHSMRLSCSPGYWLKIICGGSGVCAWGVEIVLFVIMILLWNFVDSKCVLSGSPICRELKLRKETYSSSFAISDSILALLLSWQWLIFVAEEWTFLCLRVTILTKLTASPRLLPNLRCS